MFFRILHLTRNHSQSFNIGTYLSAWKWSWQIQVELSQFLQVLYHTWGLPMLSKKGKQKTYSWKSQNKGHWLPKKAEKQKIKYCKAKHSVWEICDNNFLDLDHLGHTCLLESSLGLSTCFSGVRRPRGKIFRVKKLQKVGKNLEKIWENFFEKNMEFLFYFIFFFLKNYEKYISIDFFSLMDFSFFFLSFNGFFFIFVSFHFFVAYFHNFFPSMIFFP